MYARYGSSVTLVLLGKMASEYSLALLATQWSRIFQTALPPEKSEITGSPVSLYIHGIDLPCDVDFCFTKIPSYNTPVKNGEKYTFLKSFIKLSHLAVLN